MALSHYPLGQELTLRWLTTSTLIEAIGADLWSIQCRDSGQLGTVEIDQGGKIECTLSTDEATLELVRRRIEALRAPPEDAQAPRSPDPSDDLDRQRYCHAVASCCQSLNIPNDYGSQRQLEVMPEPSELRLLGQDIFDRPQFATPSTAEAWSDMHDAAIKDEVMLDLVSAFRDFRYQAALIEKKLQRGISIEQILRVNTAPGYSEHHTGRALDLTTPGVTPLEPEFEHTDAFTWLRKNGAAFGFVMSYPENNPHGVVYEPWHWCHSD